MALLFCALCWQVAAITLETEQTLAEKVKANPTDSSAHIKLMQWHLKWGELSKAMDVLKAAVSADPLHAWEYQERLGDMNWKFARDQHAAEARYRSALEANPLAKRALLHYGMLRRWRGQDDEAARLFEGAVEAGILRDTAQRPLEELDLNLPARGAWGVDEQVLPKLAPMVKKLAEQLTVFRQEYQKWNRTRPQDAEADKEGLADPFAKGRWLHFWVFHPRFERGVWNGNCHYKTPKICALLKQLNGTTDGVRVLRAEFDVLEAGGTVRPHCHVSNRELIVDVCLQAPRNGAAVMRAQDEERGWSSGDVRVFDPSYEHSESNQKKGADAGREDVDYLQELRTFYEEQGNLAEKEQELPAILEKWKGREEKMLREMRKKYLGDRGERVLLRLLISHPEAKGPSRSSAAGGGSGRGGGGSVAVSDPAVQKTSDEL